MSRCLSAAVVFCLALGVANCVEVTIPPEDLDAGTTTGGTGGGDPVVPGETGGPPDTNSGGLNPTDTSGSGGQDIELPPACTTHCDCPQGWDCTNQRCVEGSLPIYCCGNDACPTDASCWTLEGAPGNCGS